MEGLNPEDGNGFATAYIDDILVYSRTLKEHLGHCTLAFEFVRPKVEYLSHIITASGLKTSPRLPRLTNAVLEFLQPSNVHGFLGMSSYYRRFIQNFAQPLHDLMCKGATFEWSTRREEAFKLLKE